MGRFLLGIDLLWGNLGCLKKVDYEDCEQNYSGESMEEFSCLEL